MNKKLPAQGFDVQNFYRTQAEKFFDIAHVTAVDAYRAGWFKLIFRLYFFKLIIEAIVFKNIQCPEKVSGGDKVKNAEFAPAARLLVDNFVFEKNLAYAGKVFDMNHFVGAREKIAIGVQRLEKPLGQALLVIAVEIDHGVAAENDIVAAGWPAVKKIENFKFDHFGIFGLDTPALLPGNRENLVMVLWSISRIW